MRMIEHCNRIEEIRERLGNSFETFISDSVYEDAINMNIFQIGELSNQLSVQIFHGIESMESGM